MAERIEIDLHIGGAPYATRYWPAVPRVGDEVMLRRVDRNTREVVEPHAFAVVQRVVWGPSEQSERMNPSDVLRVVVVCAWKTG